MTIQEYLESPSPEMVQIRIELLRKESMNSDKKESISRAACETPGAIARHEPYEPDHPMPEGYYLILDHEEYSELTKEMERWRYLGTTEQLTS